jgi:hypothetical protein
MTNPAYKRSKRFIRRNYANVVATLALVIALTSAGAMAGSVFVTSKQIRNGSILTQDIHKGAVKTSDIGTSAVGSSDIKSDAVQSSDIGTGQVTPQDVTMPDPEQLREQDVATSNPTMAFAKLDDVGSYTKEDPTSTLEVDWTGSVEGHNGGEVSGCVFQIRVDGQPAQGGGGEVFGQGITSVAAAALFGGLGTGPHQIEIWARLAAQEPGMGGKFDSCTVGPAAADIAQTVVVSEQVI